MQISRDNTYSAYSKLHGHITIDKYIIMIANIKQDRQVADLYTHSISIWGIKGSIPT